MFWQKRALKGKIICETTSDKSAALGGAGCWSTESFRHHTHTLARLGPGQTRTQAEPQNYPLASVFSPEDRTQRGCSNFGRLDSYEVVDSIDLDRAFSQSFAPKWDGNMQHLLQQNNHKKNFMYNLDRLYNKSQIRTYNQKQLNWAFFFFLLVVIIYNKIKFCCKIASL